MSYFHCHKYTCMSPYEHRHWPFLISSMDTDLCLGAYGQTYKRGLRTGSSNSKCKLFTYIQRRVRDTSCSTSAPSVRKVHYPPTPDTPRVGYLSRLKWRVTRVCKSLANRPTETARYQDCSIPLTLMLQCTT